MNWECGHEKGVCTSILHVHEVLQVSIKYLEIEKYRAAKAYILYATQLLCIRAHS